MRFCSPRALLCAAVLAAAAGATPIPTATPVGDPVNCIPMPIGESRVRDDRTIDFFVRGRVYRSVLPYACSGLGSERAFSYATAQTQVCSQDIITVLQRSGGGFMRGASCGLGPFQPVTGIR